MVPAMIIPVRLNGIWRVWAQYAAGGITISLGRGKIELSMAIIRPTTQYPPVLSAPTYQVLSDAITAFSMRRWL